MDETKVRILSSVAQLDEEDTSGLVRGVGFIRRKGTWLVGVSRTVASEDLRPPLS